MPKGGALLHSSTVKRRSSGCHVSPSILTHFLQIFLTHTNPQLFAIYRNIFNISANYQCFGLFIKYRIAISLIANHQCFAGCNIKIRYIENTITFLHILTANVSVFGFYLFKIIPQKLKSSC